MSGAPGTTAEMEAHQEGSQLTQATSADIIIICLGPAYQDAQVDQLEALLLSLREALNELAPRALVAYPVTDPHAAGREHAGLLLQPYLPVARQQTLLVQTASSYLGLYEVMRAHNSYCGLLLGGEAQTLAPAALRALIDTVLSGKADLAMARYSVGPNEALVNASILHPVSRALFGVKVAFPLALDLAVSLRMAEKAATAAQRFTASSQPEAIVWVAAEAAVAGFTVAEIDAGSRELPHPGSTDLASILGTTAASLFGDVEAKAAYWQRVRPPSHLLSVSAVRTEVPLAEPVSSEELSELITSFRMGYGSLHEIWSLVLPPQTLLGLKRLSTTTSADFVMTDALWVRVVYDFALAHRLRTINRSHLLGSFTPLYLAWVASHILRAKAGATEDLARAFEADKPYLVSRWRWPDRFNP